jgi:hypothetical protein
MTAQGAYDAGAQSQAPPPPNHWACADDTPATNASTVHPAEKLKGQRNMGNFLFEVTRPKRDGDLELCRDVSRNRVT